MSFLIGFGVQLECWLCLGLGRGIGARRRGRVWWESECRAHLDQQRIAMYKTGHWSRAYRLAVLAVVATLPSWGSIGSGK